MVNVVERTRKRARDAREYCRNNKKYLKAAATLDLTFLFSCVGDRLWSFSIGFFIADLGGLAWVAMGQLLDSIVKLLLLPMFGSYLDRTHRHKGMQIILLLNNTLIIGSALCFYLSLAKIFNEYWTLAFLIAAVALNALSRVASEAQKTAFMKDWLVVIVQDSENGQLSTHNSTVLSIDQCAAACVPFISGSVMTAVGHSNSALIFMVWNILSWAVEASVVRHLYNTTPALHLRDQVTILPDKGAGKDSSSEETCSEVNCSAVTLYFRQKCSLAAFALALLFMTVLGFDNIAIAFGNEQHLTAQFLGGFRSGGAVLGFIGVWFYKALGFRFDVAFIALIGLVLQNVMINLCTVSIFLPGNDFDLQGYAQNVTVQSWWDDASNAVFATKVKQADPGERGFWWTWENSPSLLLFFCGITFARFGLWMFDPAVAEIMQETIPETERYRVNMMQSALQEFFSILKDILVVAFPLASTFSGLIAGSCSFVFLGLLVYISYWLSQGLPVRKRRPRPSDPEVPQLELKVLERGIHPELEELLEEREKEAPLQTNRTEGL